MYFSISYHIGIVFQSNKSYIRFIMRYFNSISHKVKPILSGHDTFALRYGWSKKVYDRIEEISDETNVFSQKSAISAFGVGKNMLNAMRHWSFHLGLIERNNRLHTYYNTKSNDHKKVVDSEILGICANNAFYHAEQFFDATNGLDPYLESPSTLWLFHWALSTNPNLITYYWFFNINTKSELSRDEFLRQLKDFLNHHPEIKLPSDLTIKKDIDCFILNYATKRQKDNEDIEASIESPLVELGLISRPSQAQIRAVRGQKSSLSVHVFVYCLVQFWQKHNHGAGSLSLEMATYDECSVGRVFMLDEEALIGYAEQLESFGYPIMWTQSAGIRQFQLVKNGTLDDAFAVSIINMKKYDYAK